MSRRPKNRRSTNRCWMCKAEKLFGRPTRQELKATLDFEEQLKTAEPVQVVHERGAIPRAIERDEADVLPVAPISATPTKLRGIGD